MTKWVYTFGDGLAEAQNPDVELLGGKGAGLAQMSALGLPVPPGFTITTSVCQYFYTNNRQLPDGLKEQIANGLKHLEQITGQRFGAANRPLLVSVRSGSRASMPGMMDTILNLGLNDESVEALAAESDEPRFAYDSYRRFIQMYADVVMGLDTDLFEEILDEEKTLADCESDTELSLVDLKRIVERYKQFITDELDEPFPQDPDEQLNRAIGGVLGSWMNRRAVTYRALHNIPDDWGTAVNIQAMVFGNRGQHSATGVMFTRDPATGDKVLYGEYLPQAQGEDVVAGLRTPQAITEAGRISSGSDLPSLEKKIPQSFEQLIQVADQLEAHFRDIQDIEFTIDSGKLWLLQTRAGKRSTIAAIRIAVAMANEGLIDRREAICRVDPGAIDQLLHPTIDANTPRTIIGTGLPASPGAATGEIVFAPEDAAVRATEGHSVILVRVETSPEDIHGMHAATGILTSRGGMTSHAAVVARGMGKPCVCGAGSLQVDIAGQCLHADGQVFKRGDLITIDGATGQVLKGRVAMREPEMSDEFAELLRWADEERQLRVRANADTISDARAARAFGAEGIGLCRTEHMFFDEDRIIPMREMILAQDSAGRQRALEKLLPMQRDDFAAIFRIMAGQPVTLRLLDPPLHEFLPKGGDEITEVANSMGVSAETLRLKVEALREFNPMLGHRGCRLAISYPEVLDMQVRAMIEAVFDAEDSSGRRVELEIMVPLVALKSELDFVKSRIDAVANTVSEARGGAVHYRVGSMIELPRAVYRADAIAEASEFFSFGTNDLTQTTFGISRDDAAIYMKTYQQKGIVPRDPFVTLDVEGVGELLKMAAEKGRASRPELELGVCGEHGGDPASIQFFHQVGLDYISCSPFRLPIARLAAAQAAIFSKQVDI